MPISDARVVRDRLAQAGSMWLLPHHTAGDDLRRGRCWSLRLCHGRTGSTHLSHRPHPADCPGLLADAGRTVRVAAPLSHGAEPREPVTEAAARHQRLLGRSNQPFNRPAPAGM